METQRPKFREPTINDFNSAVFSVLTIGILSSVFWVDQKDLSGYYQNLIIASYSIVPVIWNICQEITHNKNNGFMPPKFISFSYSASKILILFCCVTSLFLFSMADKNTVLNEHVHNNKYYEACWITFIPIAFTVFWGYIYPLVASIPYNSKIHYADRPN